MDSKKTCIDINQDFAHASCFVALNRQYDDGLQTVSIYYVLIHTDVYVTVSAS